MTELRPLGSDQPKDRLVDDRLGYANFARAVAGSIASLNTTGGIVFAVHGPWGSGKTSAVNMAVDALEERQRSAGEEEKTIVVRFNPWWFSEQRDLTSAFFAEVSAALGEKVSSNVREGFKRFAKRVSGAQGLVSAVLSLVPAGDLARTVLGEAVALAGGAIDDDLSLHEERDRLRKALREQKKRILVIIDDVDRLPADEARQIFRLVKSVADLPNVVYLLVFDRAIAERALEQPSDPNGPQWLEKIVQASFDLPPIHLVDLRRLFLDGLGATLGAVDLPDPTRWWNVYVDAIEPWLRTPRDVGRLLNALSVTWPVLKGEVDVPDFVAVETLRLFEPRLHALIRHNQETLTGDADRSFPDEEAKFGEKLTAYVDDEQQEHIKAALQRLFPRLENSWSRRSYSSESFSRWTRERRLCSPEHFPSYFTYGVSEETLTRAELAAFLERLDDHEAVAGTVERLARQERRSGGTRAAVLLEELRIQADGMAADTAKRVLRGILYAGDRFLNPADDDANAFAVPTMWQIQWLIETLLGKMVPETRASVLREAVEASPSLATIAYTVISLSRQHGRHVNDASEPAEDRLLDPDEVVVLEGRLGERLAEAARDGSLVRHPKLHFLALVWADVSGSDVVRAWTDGLLDSDEDALRLAKATTGVVHAHGSGDRVPRALPRVNRAELERVMNPERLLARLDIIAAAPTTSAEARTVVERFKKGLAHRG
ncbi:MAG: AAA family ATPase [Geminicoccaceae bacterium]|nr:AAA family ATPase [Geminicoccaceae bacterium]